MHCWWGESASYVLSLLKSFLMEWKPYILFPNEAQEWQTAPLGLSFGCLQVEATGPSLAALRETAGDAGPGQQTAYAWTYTQDAGSLKEKNLLKYSIGSRGADLEFNLSKHMNFNTLVQWLAAWPHRKRVLGLNSPASFLCGVCMHSLFMGMGSLQVLRLPLIIQRHTCSVNWLF